MTASAKARKRLRLVVQTVVSGALIAFLVHLGRHEHLTAAWAHIGPGGLLLAGGCFAVAAVLSARRWQLFLRYQSVREPLARLTELYCIGLFCSLFLPTAAGGDAYRVFEVSRRGWPAASVLLATLQERLLGLGATMLVGFMAALCFHAQLPGDLLASVLALFAAGVLAVACVLYLGPLLGRARRIFGSTRLRQVSARLNRWPPMGCCARFLRPLREAPAPSAAQVLRMLVLALATFAAAVAMYAVVCDALDVPFGWLELCLIVSVVGVVRMLPISLGGVGVGEAAFVGMMGLFGVANEKAAPVALVLLGVSTVMSLLGGGFAVRRMLCSMRSKSCTGELPPTEALAILSLPATLSEQRGVQRHLRDAPVTIDFPEVPAALLAGGLATRLRPLTHTIPKAMVEVAGRPFIDHQLDLLRRNGIRRIVLCLGYLGEQVANHVGDGSARGLEIRYSFDGAKLLGTGGALRRALPLLGEACWVLYGDSYLDIDYRAVFDAFRGEQALGLMTVLRNANRWDRSNVVFRRGKLVCYDKRRSRPDMEYIDYGACLFRRPALERIRADEVADLADLMHDLVQSGEMAGYEVRQRFYEIGSHQGLEETARYLQTAGLSI